MHPPVKMTPNRIRPQTKEKKKPSIPDYYPGARTHNRRKEREKGAVCVALTGYGRFIVARRLG